MDSVRKLDDVKKDIDAAYERGNNYIDITGGEPTVYPEITELVKYALSKGMKTCIITNGLVSERRANEIMDVGLDDWLISVHGLEKTHDFLVQAPNARKNQVRFLNQIRERMTFRFNSVINGYSQNELPELAKWMIQYKPRIVNFIHFNCHHNWGQHPEEVKEVIADLRKVEPLLNEAITILESNGIGVNVRYYPMCRIREDYRRCVCNDLQVMFDPYKWDYGELPKTVEQYTNWGIKTSSSNEEKGEPCCRCDLQRICGGMHRVHNKITEGKMLDPVINSEIIDKSDFYYYRKNNVLTLKERV
jgi:MoaA/NifB/PqqE/SkfB family radical SAM enzyme